MTIAIIGTGIMGISVGQTLLGKGHTVRCYNRTPENAAALHAVLQGADELLAHARPGSGSCVAPDASAARAAG